MRCPVVSLVLVSLLAACDIDTESDFRSCAECDDENDDNDDENGEDDDEDCDGKKKPVYPGLDWKTGTPEEHGLSSEQLEELAQLAGGFEHASCLLVAHEGVLVGEWYFNGYDADTDQAATFSIMKSVTATLLGIADDRGILDIDDRASIYIPQWQGTELEDITVRDLMVHVSGRSYSVATDFQLAEQYDQTAFAVSQGQAVPPGSEFIYSNVGYQTLEAILQSALGGELEAFAQEELFEPLGMTVSLTRDPSGNILTYRGLSTSCRDLARLGHLYLQKGRWKDEQVLPRVWVKKSFRPSTEFNVSYGYGWWLNGTGHVMLPLVAPVPEYDGKFIPSAPSDVVTALGAFGNILSVNVDEGYTLVYLRDAFELEDILGLGKIDAIWAAFEAAKM